MRATLKGFTGSKVTKQVIGGPDEMCDAEVYCLFTADDGTEFRGTARVKQTTGSNYSDKMIEIYPVKGLPEGTEYDHGVFRERATQYYTEKIVKSPGSRP
jgi:hypothetical protein